MAKKINYYARNFADVREELINYIKQYYPDLFSDFNDASIGSMLIELNAAVSDMLSFHTDRMYNETQIDYAQERKNVFAIARTLGLKIPGLRPSVTLVDFVVTVPPFGDTWDIRYAPIIRYGSQVVGGGQTFENLEDIDFSSPFSSLGGVPNRLILPNIDENGILQNYNIVKRELVVNGSTKIFKKVITSSDAVPFLELTLPDKNVLSIESVISLEGTDYVNTPTLDQFVDPDLRWYEVDSLAEDKVFIEDGGRVSDNLAVKPGKYVETTKRFYKEFTDNNFCKITFGSGDPESDNINSLTNGVLNIQDFINTTSLGEIPKANTTMFIRYRVGGGPSTNVGPNVISSLGNISMIVDGPTAAINNSVNRSLRVNNPIPALGGAGIPSVEQVRQMTKYNFASQNRAVTIKDYTNLIFKMPGKFGVPFRFGVTEEQNKIQIYIIGLDSNGKLNNTSTNTLKENIATWLADYRMINDYVLTQDGKIINLSFEVDLFIDKAFNQSEIINNTIQSIKSYFDVTKWEMGDSIYLAQLIENINNVGGVLNVTDIRIFNPVGGDYSLNKTPQELLDEETRQINSGEDFALFGETNSMFEIKYPERDILVRVKRASVTNG
jgi:hypothetical protein